jgi:YVTN family beta-propeller protein
MLTFLLAPASSRAQNVYRTIGVAVTPDGARVYVTNFFASIVSVIDTATNTISATIPVGIFPNGVVVTPDGTKVYVANDFGNTVPVIDTATNTVIATIPVGNAPLGVAVTPDGTKVYVANRPNTVSVVDTATSTVSVVDTATNTVSATIPVGNGPVGIAVKPDGSEVYLADVVVNTVSVIDPATNIVIATIPGGNAPAGVIIQPPPRFAGIPGSHNCQGTSVSTLATKFRGVDTAAAALRFSSVKALQDEIRAFCEG